ncbi:MAG: hypothetical protein JGK17_29315 [Microcoleus sp. PH2017_10_PVI_O_A]|uniref:hypothetical protein n=1 Tax=unclassified Microcoleus TaxID=2642155 RepID=UPI001D7EBB39|nr:MULTISPECIES: hypothetical protein [unclassified Microcoleus]TAE78942.1 MAG: hypothetical protein EAZ83_23380 [Oscillatoriales cyanobacterium]MCC3409580.1 hypothetical protein [Microcoleus sp. PH2017_10_PVI_O_A]MCC3462315.1 hypothetical protein [Microcoleus sp. PH2017_11_PCY_U_A]MCC3481109.1 hypothetical protein [Microcoleus sp. PH2017_12_PCY_D_A]MCC3532364.1 hypothetical protein [Microcoleus sp. PH2017_21_RUC_O_A]
MRVHGANVFFGKIAIVATFDICGTIALLLYNNLFGLAIDKRAIDLLISPKLSPSEFENSSTNETFNKNLGI